MMLREKVEDKESRLKVPMHWFVADCAVVVMKFRNGNGAKGVACWVSFDQSPQSWV